ncbi:MAG: hypothetical protein ACTSRS_22880 [Candidatus Helarchaeota archaeon]
MRKKYPLKIGDRTNIFHIGTIKNPKNLDSHVWRDKWTVNPINHWVVALGQKITLRSAIHNHLVVVLHELTHVMSGILHGDRNDKTLLKYDWDDFLSRILIELNGDENGKNSIV